MIEEYRCIIPVLMIGFNRPDNIAVVFDKVKQAKPTKLYIAIDAARNGVVDEDALVEETKRVVENVDWDCQVYRKYNPSNLGAEVTISSALRWVCEQEEYFIMLEDDIVVPLSFFKFQEEMLIRYKDYDNIKLVSGDNFTPLPTPNGEDYFFSRYGHTWGWGSWRRVWKDFYLDTEIKEEHCKLDFCRTISCCEEAAKYTQRLFKQLRKQGVGNCTWDYISSYKCRVNNMMSIVPRVNLATNIGVHGLHARGVSKYHFVHADENFEVIKHPEKIEFWEEYDRYHFENHFPKNYCFPRRVFKYLVKILKIRNGV